ncbi:MAG: Chaperone SurA [Candidatus Scalindua arabica]|uniref:Chaperone SurA n=1 Tax=Candidatus Scalindua arabica TaxID=1127984 RepID=A0A941W785_9BACT|nr:Chaperone SurA [Candidatus Scalindua arabica]
MKVRIIITLISFSFLGLLINGCGDDGGQSPHAGVGGGAGDMNFEQQALKKEQEDLAKLKARQEYKPDDYARIHQGVGGATATNDPNEAIAMVNGEPILRLELDAILDKVKQKVSTKRLHLVEEKIIKDLVTQFVLKQFIRKENIQISPTRIEEEINAFRENIKNNPDTADKSLETLMEEQGGGINELRMAMDISLSVDEYLNRTVSEEEMKKYFTENIGIFNNETVTASHILIDTRTIKDEEGLKKAKEDTERIKKELDNGADFAKLAEENSDCPSAKSGGELGVITRGQMVEEFEKTAFSTGVNSISEPVKTKFGYHIIKITDKQAGKDITFEETKENVKLALFNEKTMTLIQELNDNADVNILYTPTPYASTGGHGSMAHGSTMYGGPGASPHGGSSGRGNPNPHAGMPMPGSSAYGGGDPHASSGSPHGGAMSSTE